MVLIPPEIEHFQIDFAAFEQALTPHTKGVVVNSPNNPSGVVYSRETLERLAEILGRKEEEYGHPIYLISDEPYREIVFSGFQAPWIPHLYRDTIVCYSFSKSLSLPGERLGYVLVPGQAADSGEVYAAVAGAGRSLGYVNAPSLFQQVTSLCCDMTADLSVYERNCKLLVPALREMGYHVAEPGGGLLSVPPQPGAGRPGLQRAGQAVRLAAGARLRLRGPGPLPPGLLRPDGDDPAGAAQVPGAGGLLPLRLFDKQNRPDRIVAVRDGFV